MEPAEAFLLVEVVYARSDEQVVCAVRLPRGSTIRDAIEASGICRRFPGIDPDTCIAGVFGRRRPPAALLRDGDRVEIYRALRGSSADARRRGK
jgi:putative ubiquitin-RnfH superfamily antitoxin RatB of RatAB toxin-antitoxin module